jgi:hypothetical protein
MSIKDSRPRTFIFRAYNPLYREMPPYVQWMTDGDYEIIRYLAGHTRDDFRAAPMGVATNIDKSASYVRRRMRGLATVGLLENVENAEGKPGYYRLSDLGYRFLADDLSDDEREHIEEADPDTE